MANIIKTLGFIIISIILGFILTNVIVDLNYKIGSTSIPFFLWIIFTVIITISLRSFSNRIGKTRKKSFWEPPEQIRHSVISTPQFVGRFDRDRGLLDSTARLVEPDQAQRYSPLRANPIQMRVIRFRGELLDQSGVSLDEIPVEIKGDIDKWVGSILEGDRLRVEGKIEDDGILHAKNAFNYSTNSWVGERR